MSACLLDINVLIALTWPSHVHHGPARRWFAENAPGGWATCPVTQLGFVRVSSTPRIIPEAVSPAVACDALRQMTAHPHHVFWPADVQIGRGAWNVFRRVMGHRQCTDAYLLAVALAQCGRLATLDRAISALVPPGTSPEVVVQIPA